MRFIALLFALLEPVVAVAQPKPPPAISQLKANPSGARTALGLGLSPIPSLNGPITPARPTVSTAGVVTTDGTGTLIQGIYSERVLSNTTVTLTGYWRLNDLYGSTTLLDSKAGNNLTSSGSGLTSGQPGLLPGGGFGPVTPSSAPGGGDASWSTYFSGGYAPTSSASLYSYEYTQPWTISFLVRPGVTRSGSAHEYSAVSKRNSAASYIGYQVALRWTGTATVVDVGLNNSLSTYNQVHGSTDLQNSTPYVITVTYDGNPADSTGGVRIYVNGTEDTEVVANQNLGTNTIISTAPLTIGSDSAGVNPVVANLQEVAIYTGVMPLAEIQYQAGLALGRTQVAAPSSFPIQVILDNDMSTDVGNAEFYATAYALQQSGYLKILAITVPDCGSSVSAAGYSAAVVQAISAYETTKYGAPSVPIGANQTCTATSDVIESATIANNWYTGAYVSGGTSPWTIAHFGSLSLTPIPVLRQALASSSGGVVIVAAGPTSDLSALLNSPADSISPLTGSQLISAKVSRLVISAGCYPTSSAPQGTCPANPEFNVASDIASSQNVFENWPTEIDIPGIELGTALLASPMYSQSTYYNVTGSIYEYIFSEAGSSQAQRPAWDALPVLFAASGIGQIFDHAGLRGTVTVNGSGQNSWGMTAGKATYLRLRQSNAWTAGVVDKILNAR